MNIYKIDVLGVTFKTTDRIHKYYADMLNKSYVDLVNNYGLLQHNAMNKFDFILSFVIIYNKANRLLDILYQDKVLDIRDVFNFLSFYEDYYKIVKYV